MTHVSWQKKDGFYCIVFSLLLFVPHRTSMKIPHGTIAVYLPGDDENSYRNSFFQVCQSIIIGHWLPKPGFANAVSKDSGKVGTMPVF